MALLTVAHVSALSPGEARAVEVGGRAIALLRPYRVVVQGEDVQIDVP